ncbi:MAG: hypothetical protein JRN20_13975 [Nitrososphaerota archaeon]|nr:hypothetical protein [Nitrososphaerota archaeon]
MKRKGVLAAIFLIAGVALMTAGSFELYEAFHDCPLPDDCGKLNGTTTITCTIMCPTSPNPDGLQLGASLLLVGLISLATGTVLLIRSPNRVGE